MSPDSFWGGVLVRLVAHAICASLLLLIVVVPSMIRNWKEDRRMDREWKQQRARMKVLHHANGITTYIDPDFFNEATKIANDKSQ